MLPLVAIIGRPNVGKSTLFNRLVGRRTALVADEPGMTRDRHYATVERDGHSFLLVDTGGFEPDASSGIEALIASQTRMAIEEADVILLLFDGRAGLTTADEEVVALLRRSVTRTVLYVVNKIDGAKQEALVADFYTAGVQELWPVSAEHGVGFSDLADAVVGALPDAASKTKTEDSGIRVALVGRPNSGKSALLNRLVGDERSIVSDMPGTTRDPVDAQIESEHGRFTLVDTAGIRRRTKSGPALERLAALWSVRRISDAEVACLVIDADQGPTIQDAKIANAAMEAGRAMVLVLSKSDLLAPPLGAARRRIQQELDEKLGFASFAPWVLLSSLTGRGVKRLLPVVRKVRASWETRISTSRLNRFLEQTAADHPPPSYRGRPVNLMYISQPQACPPTLVIHANRIEGLSATYRRYLANRLREAFNFEGTPVRLFLRQDKAKKARGKGMAKRRPKKGSKPRKRGR